MICWRNSILINTRFDSVHIFAFSFCLFSLARSHLRYLYTLMPSLYVSMCVYLNFGLFSKWWLLSMFINYKAILLIFLFLFLPLRIFTQSQLVCCASSYSIALKLLIAFHDLLWHFATRNFANIIKSKSSKQHKSNPMRRWMCVLVNWAIHFGMLMCLKNFQCSIDTPRHPEGDREGLGLRVAIMHFR